MPDPSGWSRLTEREIEIMAIATEGLSNKRVGARLGIAEATVKAHWVKIAGKLGCINKPQAIFLVAEPLRNWMLRRDLAAAAE